MTGIGDAVSTEKTLLSGKIEEGKAIGIEEGKAIGIAEGKLAGKEEALQLMIDSGMTETQARAILKMPPINP